MTGNAKKASSLTNAGDTWWVLRGGWFPVGRRVAGPFSSSQDAYVSRSSLERFAGGETFWIDSEAK